jgi:hypothetical protein
MGSQEVMRNSMHVAAESGELQTVKMLHEAGVPFTIVDSLNAAEYAIKKGNWECFDYMVEQGCPLTSLWFCKYAAYACDLGALQHVRAAGCPWDEEIMSILAAEEEGLHLVQWAHENGCPWDYETIYLARGHSNWDIVEYCQTHGLDFPVMPNN